MRGLEPPRPYGHTDLNRARLPIPPHPRGRANLSAAPGLPRRRLLPRASGMLTRDRTRSSCVLLVVTRGFALIALLLVLAAGAEAQPGATPSPGGGGGGG